MNTLTSFKTSPANQPPVESASVIYPSGFGENLAPSIVNQNNAKPDIVVVQPLVQFPADIFIPVDTTVNIPIQLILGSKCVGFLVVAVVASVFVSINGGGFRTVLEDFAMDGCQINSLTVNGGTGGCTVQLIGV